ncbi:hypothetical protein Barb6_01263 [Bacteroidales bacterium Barb6]|nr:hypothetical protein Barb6_01263 [Bacteroidales bacterium Barb6]
MKLSNRRQDLLNFSSASDIENVVRAKGKKTIFAFNFMLLLQFQTVGYFRNFKTIDFRLAEVPATLKTSSSDLRKFPQL